MCMYMCVHTCACTCVCVYVCVCVYMCMCVCTYVCVCVCVCTLTRTILCYTYLYRYSHFDSGSCHLFESQPHVQQLLRDQLEMEAVEETHLQDNCPRCNQVGVATCSS